MKLNQMSPPNNLLYDLNKQENENENNQNKLYNAPASVQRTYKYKDCYILNNLNNYQPNVISCDRAKTNKYSSKNAINNSKKNKEISNSIENENEENNEENSCTKSENLKTNGASSSNKENNSLIQPSINGLNTITFNINNNYNNCYSSYNDLNQAKQNFIQFNGYMSVNGLEGLANRSVSN